MSHKGEEEVKINEKKVEIDKSDIVDEYFSKKKTDMKLDEFKNKKKEDLIKVYIQEEELTEESDIMAVQGEMIKMSRDKVLSAILEARGRRGKEEEGEIEEELEDIDDSKCELAGNLIYKAMSVGAFLVELPFKDKRVRDNLKTDLRGIHYDMEYDEKAKKEVCALLKLKMMSSPKVVKQVVDNFWLELPLVFGGILMRRASYNEIHPIPDNPKTIGIKSDVVVDEKIAKDIKINVDNSNKHNNGISENMQDFKKNETFDINNLLKTRV